ncbi:MAG: acyltransferase [Acetatifactor sp.]|nr:acyltransferase [Acetatifactor sp.]
MKNRRSIMMVSALLIVFFHLWVSLLTRNKVEMFLRQTAYIGVDMFFFLSAYSIGTREVTDYKAFVISRFKAVYVKFLLFALVAFFLRNWKVVALVQVLTGVNLVTKGGGAFLWFLPAIMLFYLLAPLYQKLNKKSPLFAVLSVLIVWFGVGLAVTQLTKYKAFFIFWNRIPILLVGFYAGRWIASGKLVLKTWQKALAGVLLLAVGTLIMFKFGYKPALQKPLKDMFYVLAIPSSLGFICLSDLIPEGKVVKWIGSATLEMYAIQMIFGFKFCAWVVEKLYKGSGTGFVNNLVANVLTFLFVIVISVVINQCYGYLEKTITKKLRKASV